MEWGRDKSWDDNRNHSSLPSASSSVLNSSNIGFQLLKKHGWKEGTGLGISEQHAVCKFFEYRFILRGGGCCFVEYITLDTRRLERLYQLGGRLEPIETCVKKNKRGVGAEKPKMKTLLSAKNSTLSEKERTEKKSKKEKALSKRVRKMLDEDKRRQEKEFEQSFFREFWPENV